MTSTAFLVDGDIETHVALWQRDLGAVRRLAAWGFASTALARFEIVAAVGNVRSQRVAEKAGAVREGVLRSRLWLFEVPHDAVIYSIVQGSRPSPLPGPW